MWRCKKLFKLKIKIQVVINYNASIKRIYFLGISSWRSVPLLCTTTSFLGPTGTCSRRTTPRAERGPQWPCSLWNLSNRRNSTFRKHDCPHRSPTSTIHVRHSGPWKPSTGSRRPTTSCWRSRGGDSHRPQNRVLNASEETRTWNHSARLNIVK